MPRKGFSYKGWGVDIEQLEHEHGKLRAVLDKIINAATLDPNIYDDQPVWLAIEEAITLVYYSETSKRIQESQS